MTVVVPVYNPRPSSLEDLLASFDAQTLPEGALEVQLVDDGSPEPWVLPHLRSWAAQRPWVEVTSIPASGWPGRPRNVGTARARGTYLFYCDQDDVLLPDALRRLVAQAERTGADVVTGKYVRVGSPTPYWNLARGDLDDADLVADGVMQSRTVHKLFRRAFVQGHAIAFPEGRVRLEDHHFMSQVFASDPHYAVLASVPCYRWINRNDGTNNTQAPVDPVSYWHHYGEAVRAADRPGARPEVLRALRGIAARQALSRRAVTAFDLRADDARSSEVFDAVARCVDSTFPPDVDPLLPALRRAELQALRQHDDATLRALRSAARHLSTSVETLALAADGAVLRARLRVRALRDGDEVLRLDLGAGRFEVAGVDPDRYDLSLRDADQPTLEASIVNRRSSVEWPVTAEVLSVERPATAGIVEELVADVTIPLERLPGGRVLGTGPWAATIRFQLVGTGRLRPIPVAEHDPVLGLEHAFVTAKGPRRSVVRRSERGNLVTVTGPDPSAGP